MKTAIRVLFWISLLLITPSMRAQTESGNDDPSFTSNLGVPFSVPLNPTAHFISGGWGVDYGAGYNFTRRHAVIGEFMWNYFMPQTKLSNKCERLCNPPKSAGTAISLLLRGTIATSCAAGLLERISLAAEGGITATRAFRSRSRQAPPPPVIQRGFGGVLLVHPGSLLRTRLLRVLARAPLA